MLHVKNKNSDGFHCGRSKSIDLVVCCCQGRGLGRHAVIGAGQKDELLRDMAGRDYIRSSLPLSEYSRSEIIALLSSLCRW